jgi:hypothetical protein
MSTFSVFCRRAKDLCIPLRKLLKPGEKLNVVFDSTGVKVFGEGEWKGRKHGYSKRRTWRKIHVGMCADSGQIVVSAMTSNNVSDDEAMIYMMDALEGTPLGDGAYDTLNCREAVHGQGGKPIFPPDKNANCRKESRFQPYKKGIGQFGEYKSLEIKADLYGNKKSDTIVDLWLRHLFRYKTILGDRLTARRQGTQATEVAVKLDVLNRMTELGMPKATRWTS